MKRFLAAQLIALACLFHLTVGHAQLSGGLMFPGPGMPASSGLPGPPVLTFIGSAGNATTATNTATWAAASIGTVSGFTTRRIIFVIVSNGNIPNTITSIVINGSISPTIHTAPASSIGGNPGGGTIIFSADIPTGTTASIVWTAVASFSSAPVLLTYSVDDALLVSTTPSVGMAISSASVSALTTGSYTQTVGGFAIFGAGLGGGTGGNAGWGISGFTNNFGGGTSNAQAVGSLTSIGSTVTGTSAISWTTAHSFVGGAVAAWR